MPALARLFIKTAFAYLSAGLLVGILLVAAPLAGASLPAPLAVSQVHLLVVGWVTQLIFGVSYWLFPRVSRERPYGASGAAWFAYAALNAGLVLRFIAEPLQAGSAWPGWRVALVAAAALQGAAALAFAVYVWPRLRPKPRRR